MRDMQRDEEKREMQLGEGSADNTSQRKGPWARAALSRLASRAPCGCEAASANTKADRQDPHTPSSNNKSAAQVATHVGV